MATVTSTDRIPISGVSLDEPVRSSVVSEDKISTFVDGIGVLVTNATVSVSSVLYAVV